MRDPAADADSPDEATRQANALLGKWRGGHPWTGAEAAEAEVLLKRLPRGHEPHASLLEAIEANRGALDPLAGS